MNQKHMALISFITRQAFRGRGGGVFTVMNPHSSENVKKGGSRPKRRLQCHPIIFCSPSVRTSQPGVLGRSQKYAIPKVTGRLRASTLWWYMRTWKLCVADPQIPDDMLADDGNHEAQHLKAQCPQEPGKRIQVIFSWDGYGEQGGQSEVSFEHPWIWGSKTGLSWSLSVPLKLSITRMWAGQQAGHRDTPWPWPLLSHTSILLSQWILGGQQRSSGAAEVFGESPHDRINHSTPTG